MSQRGIVPCPPASDPPTPIAGRVRHWLHLQSGSYWPAGLICRALPTTTARLLSTFVAGSAALCCASRCLNLLMKKPEEQFLSTGIDFAPLGVQTVQRGGRWPDPTRLQDGASWERVASCVHGRRDGVVQYGYQSSSGRTGTASDCRGGLTPRCGVHVLDRMGSRR